MMLSSSGPANIAGNSVSTSIFILRFGFELEFVPPPDRRSRETSRNPNSNSTYCAGLSSTISSVQRSPFFALPASSRERIALIVMPCRPMIFPTSCGCRRSSYTVVPSRSTGVIATASGFRTSPLTTYSRNACINREHSSGRRGGCSGFGGLLDEAGHSLARLRAFAHPVLDPFQVHREVSILLPWQVGAQLLDELAIARTAAISHNNAERGLVLCPDSLQSNFNCHKSSCSLAAATSRPYALKGFPKKSEQPRLAPATWQAPFLRFLAFFFDADLRPTMPMRLGQWPSTTRICHLPSAILSCGSGTSSASNGVRKNRAHAIPVVSRVLSPPYSSREK